MTVQQALDFIKWYEEGDCHDLETESVFKYACKVAKGKVRDGQENN